MPAAPMTTEPDKRLQLAMEGLQMDLENGMITPWECEERRNQALDRYLATREKAPDA